MLAGGAKALFGQLLSPLYCAGKILPQDVTYDAAGELQVAGDAVDCLVQVDRATERMTQAEGYTITDRAVYVLAQPGDPLPDIDEFTTDNLVRVDEGPHAGTYWRVGAPIDRDPAGAYWLCRGVVAKAPA